MPGSCIIRSCPLQRSDASRSPESLYLNAFHAAKRAVQHDLKGSHAKAFDSYQEGIKALSELLKLRPHDPNGRYNREQLEERIIEYQTRVETLQQRLFGSTRPSNDTGSTKSASDSKDLLVTSPGDSYDSDDDEHQQVQLVLKKARFAFDQGERNELANYADHAVTYYSSAAEFYLEALKMLHQDDPIRLTVHSRLLETLQQAEELKKNQRLPTPGFLSTPRDKTEQRSRSPSESSFHSTSSGSPTSRTVPYCSLENILTQRLSGTEIVVLKLTSNVNGKVFLPWIEETDQKEMFSFTTSFVDPDGPLPLSEKQKAKFGAWKRPCEMMKRPKLIRLVSSMSIIQDIVTDCSFVASLCIAAAYEQKFHKQLITSCIYPQNKNGRPTYNPNGKYMVKLVFNGIARKIVVDDLLPVSRDGTLMCTYSSNKEEIWASIIEKAYLKLMGGYDFPGSNSGIDLHCLTGWIPEHIFIHDKHFMPDTTWDRILDGIKFGDVLVTIATGEMTEEEADDLGLVSTHAYAVLDVKNVDSRRFMQVKNPWSHKRWQGTFSHIDCMSWTDELRHALEYDPDAAQTTDDGIFWIEFDSVCKHFTSMHLNWNPELFSHRWILHSTWSIDTGPTKDIFTLGYNPQFCLTIDVHGNDPAAVWLLLTKHVLVTEENTDYITLHVYNDANGERVYYPGQPFKEGTYVNSPHILTRFNAPPGKNKYTIVVSQHERIRTIHFSLRAYSLAPFRLREIPLHHAVEKKVPGQWTDQTAGGNITNASYMHNPQWKVTIPPGPERYLIVMLDSSDELPLQAILVEGGKRVTSVSTRDILKDTGSYRHGFCYFRMAVIRPGDYTVVASTFELEKHGHFTLTFASNDDFSVKPIPAEGAGMFQKVIHDEWIPGVNAMGCPTFGQYDKNPRFLLEIQELTTVRIRLMAKDMDPIPSMNVSIFENDPYGQLGPEVATSGPYTNIVQGVTTNDVVLSKHESGYLIVFATHDKDIAGKFTALLYSDRPVQVHQVT